MLKQTVLERKKNDAHVMTPNVDKSTRLGPTLLKLVCVQSQNDVQVREMSSSTSVSTSCDVFMFVHKSCGRGTVRYLLIANIPPSFIKQPQTKTASPFD